MTIEGEEVDDPEEYKGEPIPGGPSDPDAPPDPAMVGEEEDDSDDDSRVRRRREGFLGALDASAAARAWPVLPAASTAVDRHAQRQRAGGGAASGGCA